MKRLVQWRRGLTLRERRLLDLAAALTALVVLVYGVIVPLGAAYDAAEARHRATLRRSAALVATLDQLASAPPARSTAPLDQRLSATLQEAGLVAQSIAPRGNDRVAVTITAAPAAAVLGWLDRMGNAGVAVETLSLRPAADGTVALDVTLHQP